MINKEIIELEAGRMLEMIKPHIRGWSTPLVCVTVAKFPASKSKTKFGTASPCGEIKISDVFIGTSCLDALRETILHEYCHLITGLKHNHGPQFKRNLRTLLYIAGINKERAEEQKRLMVDAIKPKHKYTLVAITVTGEEVVIGNYHKVSKKYLEYDQSKTHLKVENKVIRSFSYIENK